MSAEVRDSEDHWALGVDDEEHAEGKSVKDSAPDLAKDNREALWSFLDSRECRPEFTEELRPEAGAHGCPPMYADATHDPRMR